MSEEVKDKLQYVDLHPAKKWKRLLAFLGDFFLSFILSFILFNVAVFPLAKVICQTGEKQNQINQCEEASNQMLFSQKILFKNNPYNSFASHVNYTFKVFLSYYAFDEESGVDPNYPQYGHKLENEVIRHYLVDIKGDSAAYLSAFNENNSDHYFTIGDTPDSIVLKTEYKTLLSAELLEVTDEENYSETMTNMRDHVFARLFYLSVYQDILDNDLIVDGISYNSYMNRIKSINQELQWVAVSSSLISLVLGWSVFYLLLPLIRSDSKTLTMAAMSLEPVNKKTLGPVKKLQVVVNSLYQLVTNLLYVIFLPSLYFGVAYCFSLPLLFVLGAISLIYLIVSLFFVLFNQHNRSLSDFLSQMVLIPTSEIDNIYKTQE